MSWYISFVVCCQVDTMIVQAIGLLDDLDKELNTYAMRVREWYGWHFPELTKIIQDNIQYAKAVKFMGNRANAVGLDFSEVHSFLTFFVFQYAWAMMVKHNKLMFLTNILYMVLADLSSITNNWWKNYVQLIKSIQHLNFMNSLNHS
jgi:snoRNA binding domain, fibrillarin